MPRGQAVGVALRAGDSCRLVAGPPSCRRELAAGPLGFASWNVATLFYSAVSTGAGAATRCRSKRVVLQTLLTKASVVALHEVRGQHYDVPHLVAMQGEWSFAARPWLAHLLVGSSLEFARAFGTSMQTVRCQSGCCFVYLTWVGRLWCLGAHALSRRSPLRLGGRPMAASIFEPIC